MGEQKVRGSSVDGRQRREFMQELLDDVAQLEQAIEDQLFETDVRRIGAEQELFLVDGDWHPAPRAMEILELLQDDPHFTTELGRFNLEINLDPLVFQTDCLQRLEDQLDQLVSKVDQAAAQYDAQVVMTGILPTLRRSHLGLDSMTPKPRYRALNDAVKRLRRQPAQVYIKGVDQLLLREDSVMLEACNTSFQIHFQVAPDEFAELYNLAQLISAPLLAASTNSPLLFGKRLWAETRIALFQQAVDTRSSDLHLREVRPRVSFGTRWVDRSVVEIFKEDISRFPVLLAGDRADSIDQSGVPQLRALRLHNGTVYRWNRPCYGISQGRPHLRIENRILPAGPTLIDQVANAAFFFGLMSGVSHRFPGVHRRLTFAEARENFLSAARLGLRSQFAWLEGTTVPAQKLIRDELLPLAEEGLTRRGIASEDIQKYLKVVDERVASEQTGSRWLTSSLNRFPTATPAQKMEALTAASVQLRREGTPVHRWPPAEIAEHLWKASYRSVEQYMTTDLFTVRESDSIDLVAHLMDWQKIRHVPVEDDHHRLVGLVSYRSLLRYFSSKGSARAEGAEAVRLLMKQSPVTVSPQAATLDAIRLMRQHGIGCLPVTQDDKLIGIITERDFMRLAANLVERELERAGQENPSRMETP